MDRYEIEDTDSTFQDGDACPFCFDGILVERYEKKLDGKIFFGCSNFSQGCEFTYTIEDQTL